MYKCPICQSYMRLEDINSNNFYNDEGIEVNRIVECTTCTVYGYVAKDGSVVEYFEG